MRLREKLRRIAAPAPVRAAPRASADGLPGESRGDDGGRYWVRRVEHPKEHVHGEFALGRTPERLGERLAEIAREPALAEVPLHRAVFFDTETTSLGGGVGTYVFLLGVGFFEADSFVVEQYFLHEVTEERAMLRAVAALLARFDLAISFHGKGFDAPRLLGRAAFHRLPFALPALHLDLCLVGRSLYRGAFSDCRLQTFETELVRFRRTDDLPGSECPRAYFDYLRGDGTLMPRVFEHNLYDVLTLPAVAAAFHDEVGRPKHPVVLSNLGAFYESVGRDRKAREAYERALEGLRAGRHPLLGRTLERLALLERRAGRHAVSAELLLERKRTPPDAFQPIEDLAKYYEHRARDLERAVAAAREARSLLASGRIDVDPMVRRRHLEAIDHRLDRLHRRMERGSHS
jgi:uncharacterized protein YprB with RNaseH-like and TPR domain